MHPILWTQCLAIVIIGLFVNCNAQRVNAEDIRCLQGTQIFPNFDESWQVKSYDTSYNLLYMYHNISIYEIEYTLGGYLDEEGYLTGGKKVNRYILHEKDSVYAYCFDKNLNEHNKKVLADSVLYGEWMVSNKLYGAFTTNEVKLLSIDTNETRGIINYVYEFKNNDSNKCNSGIIDLSYSKQLKKSSYSLLPEMDTIEGKTINRFKILGHKKYFPKQDILWGRILMKIW